MCKSDQTPRSEQPSISPVANTIQAVVPLPTGLSARSILACLLSSPSDRRNPEPNRTEPKAASLHIKFPHFARFSSSRAFRFVCRTLLEAWGAKAAAEPAQARSRAEVVFIVSCFECNWLQKSGRGAGRNEMLLLPRSQASENTHHLEVLPGTDRGAPYVYEAEYFMFLRRVFDVIRFCRSRRNKERA